MLIQVNISDEASKAGVAPAKALAFAQQVMQLPRLALSGLMCIPKATEDFTKQRQAFAQLAALQADLKKALPTAHLNTLSMGMSSDLEAAVAEGSTCVRLGTAIFGAREAKH